MTSCTLANAAHEPVDARNHRHVALAEKVRIHEHATMTMRNLLVSIDVHCVA